jgi:hypothetical protein
VLLLALELALGVYRNREQGYEDQEGAFHLGYENAFRGCGILGGEREAASSERRPSLVSVRGSLGSLGADSRESGGAARTPPVP